MTEKQKLISRQQTLLLLERELEIFQDIHIIAIERYHKNIQEDFRLRPETKASNLHDLIIDEVKIRFDGRKGFRINDDNNGFILVVKNVLFIRFKKLDELLCASGRVTNRVWQFNRQMCIEDDIPLLRRIMPEEELIAPNFANLNMGYHLDETWSKIIRLFVTSPLNERKNRWEHCFYDCDAIVAATVVTIASSLPSTNQQPEVKLKKELKLDDIQDKKDEDKN